MRPDWTKTSGDASFYTTTFQSHDLSAFVTTFANVTYLVSRGSRVRRAGNVGDLETAEAEAFRLAQELET